MWNILHTLSNTVQKSQKSVTDFLMYKISPKWRKIFWNCHVYSNIQFKVTTKFNCKEVHESFMMGTMGIRTEKGKQTLLQICSQNQDDFTDVFRTWLKVTSPDCPYAIHYNKYPSSNKMSQSYVNGCHQILWTVFLVLVNTIQHTWNIVPVHFSEICRCQRHSCQLLPHRFCQIQAQWTPSPYGYPHQDTCSNNFQSKNFLHPTDNLMEDSCQS